MNVGFVGGLVRLARLRSLIMRARGITLLPGDWKFYDLRLEAGLVELGPQNESLRKVQVEPLLRRERGSGGVWKVIPTHV